MSVDNLETHETNSVKTTELLIFVLAAHGEVRTDVGRTNSPNR